MHPSRVKAFLGVDGMLREKEPPDTGDAEGHSERVEEPAAPVETDDCERQQDGSDHTNDRRPGEPYINPAREEEMREGRDEHKRDEHINEGSLEHG